MRALILATTFWIGSLTAQAQWTEFALPDTLGGARAFSHLNDGRMVLNDTGTILVQDAFGSSSFSTHPATPGTFFTSFLEIDSSNQAYTGPGYFGTTGDLFTFDAGNSTNGTVGGIGADIQDFDGVLRDDNGLFLGGGNGTSNQHAVSYINLGTGAETLLIDDVSMFSAGIALDNAGDLYVGNNDNGEVRKFTATQLTDGINGGPAMEFSDGSLVYDFGSGGNIASIAVDDLGRIWTAGFAQNGLMVYDPALNMAQTIVPGFNSPVYSVETFSEGGTHYVGYINAAGFGSGQSFNYGYSDITNFVVPEPSSLLMLLLGSLGIVGWRRLQAPGGSK